jgi:hypothetical protein
MNDETTEMNPSHQINPASVKLLGGHPKVAGQLAGYKSRLLIALLVGFTFSPPAIAKLYKWVDEKGITHYGETIPPEYADRDREELSKSGRTVKVIEIPTAAERKALKEAEEKKRIEEKAAIERKRHDTTLTSTYSNSDEIDLARNRSLKQINSRINNNTSQLNLANDNLARLQKEFEDYTNSNKPIPPPLQDELKDAQARVNRLQNNLDKSLSDKAAVEARYDDDKARYHELTGK